MAGETRHRYLFVAIDRATRWVFVRVYSTKTAANARGSCVTLSAPAPLSGHCFAMPCRAVDNGKEFTDRLFGLRKRAATGAHVFDRLCTDLDIEHRLTPPMRPQPLGECAIHLPVSEPTVWSSGSMVV